MRISPRSSIFTLSLLRSKLRQKLLARLEGRYKRVCKDSLSSKADKNGPANKITNGVIDAAPPSICNLHIIATAISKKASSNVTWSKVSLTKNSSCLEIKRVIFYFIRIKSVTACIEIFSFSLFCLRDLTTLQLMYSLKD